MDKGILQFKLELRFWNKLCLRFHSVEITEEIMLKLYMSIFSLSEFGPAETSLEEVADIGWCYISGPPSQVGQRICGACRSACPLL